MKLFIWENPYHVRWGQSSYFAVAETVDEARKLAADAPTYAYITSKRKDWPSLPDDVRKELEKEPTRVVEVPCGEFHEWEE